MPTDEFSRRHSLCASLAASAGAAAFPANASAGPCPKPPPGSVGPLPSEDVLWLADVQGRQAPPDAPNPEPLLEGVSSLAGWKKKRGRIQQRWLDYLGAPLEANVDLPKLTVLEEDRRPPGVVQQLVEYENEPGETVRGYLITPDHLDEKRPGVVVLHPTVPDTFLKPADLSERWSSVPFGLRLPRMGVVDLEPGEFPLARSLQGDSHLRSRPVRGTGADRASGISFDGRREDFGR